MSRNRFSTTFKPINVAIESVSISRPATEREIERHLLPGLPRGWRHIVDRNGRVYLARDLGVRGWSE